MIFGYSRGHKVILDEQTETWHYEDGEEHDDQRSCRLCKKNHIKDGPDPCVGFIRAAENKPAIVGLCCGHGVPGEEYVYLDDGSRFDSVQEWREFNEF